MPRRRCPARRALAGACTQARHEHELERLSCCRSLSTAGRRTRMSARICCNARQSNNCQIMRALAKDKQASAAHAQRAPCIFLPPHLSSLHKAAHDAQKDAPHAAPHACLVRTRTGRRGHPGPGDESLSSGEHAAPQKALQLQRRKVQLHNAAA